MRLSPYARATIRQESTTDLYEVGQHAQRFVASNQSAGCGDTFVNTMSVSTRGKPFGPRGGRSRGTRGNYNKRGGSFFQRGSWNSRGSSRRGKTPSRNRANLKKDLPQTLTGDPNISYLCFYHTHFKLDAIHCERGCKYSMYFDF